MAVVFGLGACAGGSATTAKTSISKDKGTMTLVWADEFDGPDGSAPNPANWNYNVGNGWNDGANQFLGWGNFEQEWYRPENAFISGGNLVIEAQYKPTPVSIAGKSWSIFSSRLTTAGKHAWTYGKIEARIKLPHKVASWPAFWMMGESSDGTYTDKRDVPMNYRDTMSTVWASCGEIDIMEQKNLENKVRQNMFWDGRVGLLPWAGDKVGQNPNQAGFETKVEEFHVYAIVWNKKSIHWLVDGVEAHDADIDIRDEVLEEFHKPMHVILNLAIGGNYTGNATPNPADFPMRLNIDYVRVYQMM
jgi:beta-glucanase (GH16 family)